MVKAASERWVYALLIYTACVWGANVVMLKAMTSYFEIVHLDTKSKLVQYIKRAGHLKGQGREWVRAPRLPLTGDEREMVKRIVASTDNDLSAITA